MKGSFAFHYPGGQIGSGNFPGILRHFHIKDDAVAFCIYHINGKRAFLFSVWFSEIKFLQLSITFYEAGKLNISYVLQFHQGWVCGKLKVLAPIEINN